MEHVDVRHLRKRRRQPIQRVAGLDERKIERLAVVGDDRIDGSGNLPDGFEQRPLGREARKQKLPDVKAAPAEPAAADEKRIAARAAGQAGRLEIDEQQVSTARRSGKQGQS